MTDEELDDLRERAIHMALTPLDRVHEHVLDSVEQFVFLNPGSVYGCTRDTILVAHSGSRTADGDHICALQSDEGDVQFTEGSWTPLELRVAACGFELFTYRQQHGSYPVWAAREDAEA